MRILKDKRVRIRVNQTRYSEGDVVDTPDGMGIVVEVRTEEFEGPDGSDVEATEDSPAYVVGLEDEDKPVGVYTASDLSEGDFPDTGVEDPASDVQGSDVNANVGVVGNDWSMPRSWREADTPARLILLDAWSSMNGQFDCGGACCMGTLKSPRLCGAMKDEVLGGWTGWR